jgi:hypothetical protein
MATNETKMRKNDEFKSFMLFRWSLKYKCKKYGEKNEKENLFFYILMKLIMADSNVIS